MASPTSLPPISPTTTTTTSPSDVVEWSTHAFRTYTICRASLPAREGLHDLDTHFTHLPLKPIPTSMKRKTGSTMKEPERKSSAVVFTGREEWMGTDAEEEEEDLEVDNELVEMERLTPILSED